MPEKSKNAMRRWHPLIYLVALGLVASLALKLSRGTEQAMDKQIDALFTPLADANSPGAAVLVKRGSKVLFEKGYGARELRTYPQITSQSNFRLASFTKQFTAMAIMLLVRDGKLHYDDRLIDVFPNFPSYGKSITIRHLLTHTSGLPDYEDLMEKEEKSMGPRWSPEHQIQDEEVLALLEKQPKGKFAPGASWAYSNSAYVVLGLVVAKVSGMPYRDFLQKRVFAPVGMNRSIVYQKGINEVMERAFGHSKENDRFVETDQSSTSATLGDGGIYSNLADLAKWDDALQKHSLLTEKEMTPALTPVKLADGSTTHWPKEIDGDNLAPGKPVSYGFGWFLDPFEGHSRMWHSGSTMGFRTVIQRFTTDGLTIVILCNRTDLECKALAEKIATVVLAK